jgi:hypothetical protein
MAYIIKVCPIYFEELLKIGILSDSNGSKTIEMRR